MNTHHVTLPTNGAWGVCALYIWGVTQMESLDLLPLAEGRGQIFYQILGIFNAD